MLLAAHCKYRMQKSRQKSPSGHHRTTLSGYIFATKEKNLLRSNISSTWPYNMVNFGPLAAEIVSLLWGTPGNFNGFRVLAALLHGTSSGLQPNFAVLNRGRHLYSAGRPSRWALAHISSLKHHGSFQGLNILQQGLRNHQHCMYFFFSGIYH